jgi:hypothetical protein
MSTTLRENRALWAGIVVAPLLDGAHLVFGFMLVHKVCKTHHYWPLTALTLACFIAALICVWICWRDRARFAGQLGLMSATYFALLILAQHVPTFFLNPCWD